MLSREQTILAFALKLFHNPFRDKLRRVWQLGTFLQILKTIEGLSFALIDNLPHVLLPDARNQLQRVHTRGNRPCCIEEIDKPILAVQHYSGDHAWKLSLRSSSQLLVPDSADYVRNLLSGLFANVHSVARFQHQALFRERL